jgi:hypothetical protein
LAAAPRDNDISNGREIFSAYDFWSFGPGEPADGISGRRMEVKLRLQFS